MLKFHIITSKEKWHNMLGEREPKIYSQGGNHMVQGPGLLLRLNEDL